MNFDYQQKVHSENGELTKAGKLMWVIRFFDFENGAYVDGEFEVADMADAIANLMIRDPKVLELMQAAMSHYQILKLRDGPVGRIMKILAENCDCDACVARRKKEQEEAQKN